MAVFGDDITSSCAGMLDNYSAAMSSCLQSVLQQAVPCLCLSGTAASSDPRVHNLCLVPSAAA